MEFLSRHRNDVRGRVLEVGGDGYTRIFGSDVARSDVVDRRPDNQAATIVADLSAAPQIPGGTYDCIIVTQTLQYIFDVRGAIATLHRILRPGGVVLATVPGITRINRYDANDTGEFWHLTSWSVRALFEEAFVGGSVEVAAYGNVLAAVALLHGISAGELRREELDARDPDFEVLVTVRGVKATHPPSPDAGT